MHLALARTYATLRVLLVTMVQIAAFRQAAWGMKRIQNPLWRAAKRNMGGGLRLEWPVEKVRSQFVDYFEKTHQHANVRSSPCVPVNDPTLLFANAGMNQFKPIFLGTVEPSSPLAHLKRAANSQKCIRAGGKHNDLDDVGKDTYHHTFFEMLGTWSFGDYFKKEAIEWAYDILVNVYKLDPNRLYASYFGGDESLGLPCDSEARDHWLQFLPASRVLPFDRKANFWEMGDTGPCGPCSEIHYDRIGGRDASQLVNADDPDVIEIWNLVFIQFNRESNGSLRSLPNKHIDTGMGLERLTSILQDKRSNYDTDVFMPLFLAIERAIHCPPYTGKVGQEDAQQGYRDTAYRILADHLRTLTFAIADGAVPSNEGRGYVLRRVLRRAVRYGMQTLGAPPNFLHPLVPEVTKHFGAAFPELVAKEAEVMRVLREEEEAFVSLLDRGVHYFNTHIAEMASRTQGQGDKVIDGRRAFFMYDSLGFPIDLTQIMAAEKGYTVDLPGFHAAMADQQTRSRLATVTKRLAGRVALTLGADEVAALQRAAVAVTDDVAKYDHGIPALRAKVVALVSSKGLEPSVDLAAMTAAETFGVVLDRTSFYAEAGGQAPDVGQITLTVQGQEVVADVVDTQSYGGYILHTCALVGAQSGQLAVGVEALAQVDLAFRGKVAPNHTMTHVLNFALRKVLGDGVDQKGSSVTDERLRFDFSHNRGLTEDEVEKAEEIVTDAIRQGLQVSSEVVPLVQAQAIRGLRAVFGEVYPDPVRVLAIGPTLGHMLQSPSEERWVESSVEFCGGTHVANTSEALAFAIVEETAVAKGIRRISAVTGATALETMARSREVAALCCALEQRVASSSLPAETLDQEAVALRQRVDTETLRHATAVRARKQLERLQKQVFQLKNQQRAALVDEVVEQAKADAREAVQQGRVTAVLRCALGSDGKAMKRAVDEIKKAVPTLSFMVVSEDVDKLALSAFVTEDGQAKGWDAAGWVLGVTGALGGRGGGKSGAAQGSVPWTGAQRDLDQLLEAARKRLH